MTDGITSAFISAAAEAKPHALAGQGALQGPCGFPIQPRADPLEVLPHRDLCAQPAPDRTKLQADHAGADHHQVARHFDQLQGAGGVEDALVVHRHAGQRRRFRTGGDDDVARLQLRVAAVGKGHADPALALQARPALDPLHLVLAEEEFDATGQGGDALVLLLHHLRQVQFRADPDAEPGELAAARRGV